MDYMNCILHPFLEKFVVVFIDDILIYSKNKVEHEENLHQVLQKLNEKKSYANLGKCEFWIDGFTLQYHSRKTNVMEDALSRI